MKFTFAPESRPLDGYTIKRAIHRGGFGEVYYALSDAGKEVALKLLNNNLDVELRGVSQCLNLKHPNLVTIFDIRTDADNDHWVIMEFVNGRGLYETLQDYPNGMPLQEINFWLSGITAGLSFLHDRGIVHRDLKPANVFRDHGGVKVGDVGLSKYISESRRSAQTQSVGTVYYMAPEVAKGRYGLEVDVYAMGIMLFEMITGSVPFEGQTTAEILMKHLTADPDVERLPENLRPVLAAALEKDPEKRTHSVEELERQFCRAVAGADASSPVTLIGKMERPRPLEARRTEPEVPQPAANLHSAAEPFAGTQASAAQPANGRPAVAYQANPQSPAAVMAAVAGLWNLLPMPLQWVLGGAAALLVIESGMIRPVAVGGMIGGVAYLGYQLIKTFMGEVSPPELSGERAFQAAQFAETQRERTPTNHNERDRHRDEASVAETFVPASKKTTGSRATAHRSAALRVYTPATIRKLSVTQRIADMSTSVSVSLAASALVTVAVFFTTNLLKDASEAVYFGAVTMMAAWGLIVPSKLWEGRRGDTVLRRVTLGAVGLGVGFLAAKLPEYLLIGSEDLFHGNGRQIVNVGRINVADGSGFPTSACFMIFFAALFVCRRWWWQADSFRKSRFRVSSALFTLIVGVVVTGMLQDFSFPDALGATWALAISAVVQLSAGWTPPEDRRLEPAPEPVPVQQPSTAAPNAEMA
ncbi:MAG: serine/threonine-protein kinase [Fuerstiella sp.]